MNKKTLVDLGETLNGEMSIVQFCRLFDISRSTYYRWRGTPNVGELTELETSFSEFVSLITLDMGIEKLLRL